MKSTLPTWRTSQCSPAFGKFIKKHICVLIVNNEKNVFRQICMKMKRIFFNPLLSTLPVVTIVKPLGLFVLMLLLHNAHTLTHQQQTHFFYTPLVLDSLFPPRFFFYLKEQTLRASAPPLLYTFTLPRGRTHYSSPPEKTTFFFLNLDLIF